MKKSVVACTLLSVLLLTACQSEKDDKKKNAMKKAQQDQQQVARVPFPKNVTIQGAYADYIEGVIGNGEVSVLFFASRGNENFKKQEEVLAKIYDARKVGVHTYRVDFDTATDLRQRYGITVQNSYVVIGGDGNAISVESALSAVPVANTLARAAGMNVKPEDGMMQEEGGMGEQMEGELMQGMPAMDGVMEGEEHMVEVMEESDENGTESAPPAQEPQELIMGTYTDFTDDVIGNGKSSILFFAASWCPSCQAHSARISEWYADGSLYPSVYKVDYDNSGDLKQRYGVVQQDTFVRIDGEGNAVKSISFPDETSLWELIIETY